MSEYSYIFTMISGSFAFIQIAKLVLPYVTRLIKYGISRFRSNGESININIVDYSRSYHVNMSIHACSLVIILLLSILLVHDKVNTLDRTLSLSYLSKTLQEYSGELNNIKIEQAKILKQMNDQNSIGRALANPSR